MLVHRAADVEQQQNLDHVAPLRLHLDIEPAPRARGGIDGALERQFVGRPVPREFAQAPQRDLDVACAEFDLVVQIGELAPVPDLYGAAVAPALLPDAHTLGVEAMRAERGCARGADPFAASLMAFLLLLETLLQRLHQLLPAAQAFHGGLLLVGEIADRQPREPVLGQLPLQLGEYVLDALEMLGECSVEAVIVLFVLDQAGARQVVEALRGQLAQARLQGFQQGQQFRHGDRHSGLAQQEEELDQHLGTGS